MRFKKEIGLSLVCWKTLLKAMVAQLFTVAATVAIAMMVLGDVLPYVAELGVFDALHQAARGIADGTFTSGDFAALLDDVVAKFQGVTERLPDFLARIEFVYFVLIVLLIVYRMLVAITDLPVYCAVNEFMTTNGKRPFLWYFFKKFGKSVKFSAMQALIALPLDLATIFTTIGFFLLFLLPFGGLWTLIVSLAVGLFLYSLRLTLTSFWAPAVVADDLKVSVALRRGVAAVTENFWHGFYKNALVATLALVCGLALNLLWESAWAAVVSVVLGFVLFYLLKCVNLVEYFETKGLPYFYKKISIEELESGEENSRARSQRNKRSYD